LYEVKNGVGTMHVFAGKQRVASVWSDGNTQFYHTDHLGSASVITDPAGERKQRIEYDPFGTIREMADYDATFPNVSYTFTDQEEDSELGLYNFKARLYDPLIGRFVSPDTLIPDPENLQAMNRYSYCQNNPLIYTDPTGHDLFGPGGPESGDFGSGDMGGSFDGFTPDVDVNQNETQTDLNVVSDADENSGDESNDDQSAPTLSAKNDAAPTKSDAGGSGKSGGKPGSNTTADTNAALQFLAGLYLSYDGLCLILEGIGLPILAGLATGGNPAAIGAIAVTASPAFIAAGIIEFNHGLEVIGNVIHGNHHKFLCVNFQLVLTD
jgi:RHS repeat-associated protein